MDSVQQFSTLLGVPVWAIAFVIMWTLVWKGLALWRAALLKVVTEYLIWAEAHKLPSLP